MTLQVALPPELEQRLRCEAERQGLSAGAVALQLLDQYLPHDARREKTVAFLQSWIDADDVDEADSGYDFLQALDAARTSDRKLFPENLKCITW